MLLIDRINPQDRTVKKWDGMRHIMTRHFSQRCDERGLTWIDGAYALMNGKVNRIKNGCYRINYNGINLIAKPTDEGYSFITIYRDQIQIGQKNLNF